MGKLLTAGCMSSEMMIYIYLVTNTEQLAYKLVRIYMITFAWLYVT